MHLPKLPLRTSCLRGFSCLLRMVVNAGQRIVPKDEPQSGGVIVLQVTKDQVEAPTIWTLIIAIFDECVRGVLGTSRVVPIFNRK